MNKTTSYQRNMLWDVIINRAKGYHENDKERLGDNARNKYRTLSEEVKKLKGKYGRNRYHNMSKEKKRKKSNSKKIYLEANRSQFSDQKDIFLIIHIMYAMI